MIDARRYLRLEPKNVTDVLLKEDGFFYLTFKRFDNETGAEVNPPETQYINFEEVAKHRSELQEEIDGIDAVMKKVVSVREAN